MVRTKSRLWIGPLLAALVGALMSIGVAAPAQAGTDWYCTGKAVKRCATIYWNRDTDRYQGRAKIIDVDGGKNYRVLVKDITVRRFTGSGYVTVRSAGDYDGWFGRADHGRTTYFNPCKWPTNSFEVHATFSWKNASGKTTRRWAAPMAWAHSC